MKIKFRDFNFNTKTAQISLIETDSVVVTVRKSGAGSFNIQ